MSITAIPGYDVRKIGKDRYSIAVTNGNMGAAVVNRAQLEQIADSYGVKVKDNSTAKKVAAGVIGAGVLAAGIIFRKNIAKFFDGLKTDRITKWFGNAKAGLGRAYNNVTEFVADKWKKTKKFVQGLFKKGQKSTDTTIFHRGLSPELEKAKKAGIVEYAKNVDEYAAKLNSKNFHNSKLMELAEAFSAITPRSSLK